MAVATQTMTMSHTLLAASGSINIPRPLKRTSSSFDLDTPRRASKAPRTQPPASLSPAQRPSKPMPLRRSDSCLDLTSMSSPTPASTPSARRHPPTPHKATLTPFTPPRQQCPVRQTPLKKNHDHPSTASVSASPSHYISPAARTSSPLSPLRSVLPARPVFPRSKPCVNLYRKALTTSLSTNLQEKPVSASDTAARDVMMVESSTPSWFLIPETEDWDMD